MKDEDVYSLSFSFHIFKVDYVANTVFSSLVPSDAQRGRSTSCSESSPSREELVLIKRVIVWAMVNYKVLDGKLK